MENLNKENFWNRMKEQQPLATKMFCEWIDEYKKIVGWDAMFGNIFPTEKKIKFHDIPYEMQMGIMNRFFIEAFAGKEEYERSQMQKDYHGEMEDALSQLNEKLTSKN